MRKTIVAMFADAIVIALAATALWGALPVSFAWWRIALGVYGVATLLRFSRPPRAP